MSKAQSLWKRAKKVIPGGNMLLSKRAEMFLPDYWPTYFDKTQGCFVWDIDGYKYTDMSIMGIGTNILGYSNKFVDRSVKNTIRKGNMSTLNCPEEVLLAEKLIQIHPWAQMARFARSGGEANAIAVRIARAFTGKDKIAFCGYHGWHDWYLATNLRSSNLLETHLLPGLEPNGVPRGLEGTALPFNYNKIDELKAIFQQNPNDIAAVKMEVQRNEPPDPGFLEEVRRLCDDHNVILIFDECTSGFRETLGGLHLKYGVNPDIAMFGKALGNGYAITAVLGKSDVMQACQSTFISSTFWTERIGPTAALETLKIMENTSSHTTISLTGRLIKQLWTDLFKKYDFNVDIGGLDALCSFTFLDSPHLLYKTYITQEMLKRGWLASDKCYVSVAHTERIISKYIKDLSLILENISILRSKSISLETALDGHICHAGFKRLN